MGRGRRRGTGHPIEGDAVEPSPGGPAAMDIAVRFLASRPRTRWELERRLRRGGVDESVVAATLDRLETLGYVDDAAFARWLGEQRDRHAPRGQRLLEAELRRSGVPAEVIAAHRVEHANPERPPEDAALPADESDRAHDALARHLRGRPMPADPRARRRIGMFLMRRGFNAETVRTAMREVGEVEGTDDQP